MISPDGLIFDIDGTLWDSCEAIAKAWTQTILNRYDGIFTLTADAARSMMGLSAEEISDLYSPWLRVRSYEIVLKCLEEEDFYLRKHCARVYEGAAATLEALYGRLPLFVVSNCYQNYLDVFLESTNFARFFTDCRCLGAGVSTKAENLRHIISDYNLKAPYYIGDTRKDELSSREAGYGFIWAAYGFGKAENPDAVLENISALPSLL